jgi:sRNA-binding protein
MAGDWLKMTHALPEKPEVLAIAGKTGLSRFDVVGRLFILWRWFDNNTTNGNALGVTTVTLEECLFGYGSNVGFVSAVVSARWLDANDDGIRVVKFDEHISESAKTRAQTAKRVAKSKANGKSNAEGNAPAVTSTVTETVPREEKRREEKKEEEYRETRKRVPPIARPDDVSEQTWGDWVQLRKAKRSTASATAIAGARDEAGKAGLTLEAFLQVWCRRGSQTLEADWLKPHERGTNGTPYQQAQRERVAEFAPALAKRAGASPITIDEVQHVPAIASR